LVFLENASGARRERPELQAALDYMREGDTMVVWKLDRLARSLKQLIETVESLETRKVGFRSLTENIDTTTSGSRGRLTSHLFAALTEFERSINAPRVAVPARGRKGGRPPAMTAKDLTAAKALLSDPEITVDDVAKRLNVSPATLYRHLPGGRSAIKEGPA
jgi:DNA invertase Pin-like site-specific DNA recombinase